MTGLTESDLVRVDSGDRMAVGEIEVEFLHTPGHTPGSQCFGSGTPSSPATPCFIQGCGRVDLPGSDPDRMYESLKRLASLPDETVLLPGHNYSDAPRATMGETKRGTSTSGSRISRPGAGSWEPLPSTEARTPRASGRHVPPRP